MRTGLAMACCLLAVLLSGNRPAYAQSVAVDLELVLAVDISGSIDPVEAQLQREGYMAALASDQIFDAIKSGLLGRIALSYIEWAGIQHQETLIDWRIIETRADAAAFVATLGDIPLRRARRTSISGAIAYATPTFAANNIDGTRRVIDISGDGPNNSGPLAPAARDAALAEGIVINGLPIINDRPNPFGLRTMKDLDLYYRHCVIGGRGAFIVVAESFDDFAAAVLKKLILEISDIRPTPAKLPRFAAFNPTTVPRPAWAAVYRRLAPIQLVQATQNGRTKNGLPAPPGPDLRPGIADCDAGERQWQQFQDSFGDWP